ncbi:ATP-binding cassette domain-containing protein [Brevundimonas sp.]|uniref:amino acid ABC transporter ATP-binding/permease protein n=1 Tax=Brevundimonas sp. TaxID=1871086 RepID=UPI00248A0FE0|nr:ATP-binding cassette domain-containing protein [Brevundimonas sp.]MDI1281432.1 ATP-binding cassette domain-containing protein [Brevundimonas sp.]
MTGVARFRRLMREQRRRQGGRLALAAAAGAVVTAASVLLLGLSGWFITGAALAGVAGGAAIGAFNYLLPSAAIRFLAIARTGARYVERVSGHAAALKALARLRPALFDGLAAASPGRVRALSSGEASARMIQDVDAIQTLFVRLSTPWAAGAGGAIAIALAGLAGSGAAITVGIGTGLAVLGALAIGRLAADPAGARVQVATGRFKDRFSALQAAAPELRAYGLESWAVEQIAAEARTLDRRTIDAAAAAGWMTAWQGMVTGGTVIGVVLVSAGSPLPLVTLAALAAVTGIEAAGALVASFRQAGAAAEAVRRLGEVLDDPVAETGTVPTGDAVTLVALDLTLAAGRRLAVTGPSGAGKTTLIERLMALRDPVTDELRLGDVDLTHADVRGVRARFAYAAQDVRLLAGTVRDNLTLARADAGETDLWAALETADLADRVRAMPAGLDTPLGDNGERLSGGERRRLGLARACLRHAAWLVLDEPTEGLDAATEARVLERLDQRLAALGQGLILVSHRPAPLALCDRTLVVTGLAADGRILMESMPARVAA